MGGRLCIIFSCFLFLIRDSILFKRMTSANETRKSGNLKDQMADGDGQMPGTPGPIILVFTGERIRECSGFVVLIGGDIRSVHRQLPPGVRKLERSRFDLQRRIFLFVRASRSGFFLRNSYKS